ncbi:hypothetical protein OPT61_g3110 [Boeremia exigua]|uniref:Uncharacterized protein n=1 Tax=Boeremia exigua TaxID=749465 RepID=A0ACC2IJ21_9PLEO|nr:hypothetical protein OPT61_g3110 [Boeremia exigua]
MLTMVLGILIATISAPGLLGSQEAIRQGQSKDRREEHRARRCNLIATCVKSSPRSREIDGRPIVLRNGKLWIDTTTGDGEPFGHTYAGYYLPYPDTSYEGMVTTITDVAPIMNWVYIDRETHEVKYGVRADAQPNLTGPFDCTRQDRRLTFDGWEGWCAVEEYEGYWCLYFDVNDDGLRTKVESGTRVLEIELYRKEKRFKKDTSARQQDQTTQRAVDPKANTPFEQSVQPNEAQRRPGAFNEAPLQPETSSAEDAAPKTPTPAYPDSNQSVSPSNSEPLKTGAVNQLDKILAMEAQTQPAPAVRIPPQPPSLTPAPQLTSPVGKRYITPKINRNSGSKTLAQAQVFEAMIAAQTNSNDASKRPNSSISDGADSVSIYSQEDQSFDQEIRPQSSVSQRAFQRATFIPPSPTARVPTKEAANIPRSSPLQSISQPSIKGTKSTDPATFEPSFAADRDKSGQVNSLSQRRPNSKIFTARRRGKRVPPRNSVNRPLENKKSSKTEKRASLVSNIDRPPRRRTGNDESRNRLQKGRKTTSAFLKDLDLLVDQERSYDVPKSNKKSQRIR